MNSIRASLTAFLFLISFCASAKEVTDTLYSAKNDRLIVTYSITQKDNKVDLQFKSVRKLLGDYHRDKYKYEADRIQTFFFDWIGGRKDMEFTGKTPYIISLPYKAVYKKSSDGYFIVEQKPSLSFELEASEGKSFTIPLYLAHYEGKQHYDIFCSCGNLVVNIPKATTPSAKPGTKTQSQHRELDAMEDEDETSEFDTDLDEVALNLIDLINKSLPNQDAVPMESTLERQIDNLVDLQAKIKKKDITKKIDETLEAYNMKKKELEKTIAESNKQKEDDDAFTVCSTKEAYELYLKQHPNGRHVDEAKAKIDELDAKAKEEEDSKKKRNIWMIIGGVLLAILLFVGNQVLQSFRNIRTQRSMMQMQQDATKRVQNMARSKARNEIRKQTNKVTSQVRKKGQTIIRSTTDKVKINKGNNRMSI